MSQPPQSGEPQPENRPPQDATPPPPGPGEPPPEQPGQPHPGPAAAPPPGPPPGPAPGQPPGPGWGPAYAHGYPPAGPPPGTGGTSDERNWALGAHLGSFLAAYVALGLIAPLVVLLAKGNESPYIRHHAVESLNFQITTLIAVVVSVILVFVLVGILMLIAIGIAYVVLVIMASVAASRGEWYRYPVNLRLVK